MHKSIRKSLVAAFLAGALVAPAWSDTLVLRDGNRIPGTLEGANTRTLSFRDRDGHLHRYNVSDVQAVRFGNEPYDEPGPSGPPPADYRGGPPPNNYQGSDRGPSPDMEKVVLPVGTEVVIRTNERIDARDAVEGQTYAAEVDENIRDTDGYLAIPRGSDARLVIRRVENNGDLILDVDTITVQHHTYRVSTQDVEEENRREGVGANKRTGKFVGGGAILGTIIGAIAGGGKGAAIGAAAGAAGGATAQIVTRGKEIHIPPESVIRFRLDRPLRLHLLT